MFEEIQNPFNQKENLESDRDKFFKDYLMRHVADVEPQSWGNKEAVSSLSGDSFGCADVAIYRCFPELVIDKLHLEKGKSVVLIGPNGGGKSTIFDAIMGINDADFDDKDGEGGVMYGESQHAKDKLRISRLNQEELLSGMEDSLVFDVLDNAEELFKSHFPIDWADMDAYDQNLLNTEAVQRIEELRGRLTKLFNMEDFFEREVGELSGGERTKLSLCMVLLSEPDVLLLDEPTNHLDIESIAKLSGLLELYTRAGVSVLSVSHVDMYLADAGKDGVCEIKVDGHSRKLNSSKAPYDKYIKDSSREPSTIVKKNLSWRKQKGQTGGVLISTSTNEISITDSPLQEVEVPSLLANDVWVLSGNNGSGKTKLMEAMAKGEGGDNFERNKGAVMAYLPQFWPEQVLDGSVEDFYYWLKDQVDPHSQLSARRFEAAVKDVGFKSAKSEAAGGGDFLRRDFKTFSAGEQRLLWFVAVNSFENIKALLLDEPTNHMDQNLQQFVIKAIQDFPGAVVFSTHDLELLDAISNNVGEKGSTLAPKNIVLQKNNGLTTITQSTVNPAEYMRAKIANARKQAKRVKGIGKAA